jgi:outer membrane protein
MACFPLPRDSIQIFAGAMRWMLASAALFASCGCTCCAFKYQPFATPAEVASCGVAERVLIPPDLNVNPAETVQKPASQVAPAAEAIQQPVQPLPAVAETSIATFALPDAIAFGVANNPRLRSARAGIDRTRGQEQVAFAPFLPQVDLLSQAGVVSPTLAPGIPGTTGLILASGFGTRAYSETEASLQWMLYDFGRSSGRYGQAIARSQIAQLQLNRAVQTIEFDVATTYVDVLLARASRRVQDEAVLRAEAILHDTNARRVSGVVLREDVLRAEVQTSESREALVVAREGEFNSIARLNNAMGRNSGWPLEIFDLELEPPMPATLAQLLETAAAQRPEIAVARQMVEVAQQGWKAARGELLPRIFVRASGGRTDGESVVTGWQEGAGLHIETPLYSGGRNQGEIHSAEADIEAALADAQTLLDNISLEVNIAYRGVVAARERIGLSRVAVTQAEENMRLIIVRYKNGNATPTDIVDSEAAMTRSQQRFYSATYTYLAALARLDYALGQRQGTLLVAQPLASNSQKPAAEELPAPRIRLNEP